VPGSGGVSRVAVGGAVALGAAALFAVLAPAWLSDFGVYNDWGLRPSDVAGPPVFGHPESYHLVRVGRLLNALLHNVQWRQLESYADLRAWRLLAAVLLAASFVAVSLDLARATRLPPRRTVLLLFAVFLAPPMLLPAYYASLFAASAVALAWVSGTYVLQRRLFAAAWAAPSRLRRVLPVAALATLALVVGHELYTPSTALFLVLAAFSLLYGDERAPRQALVELAVYGLSCALYLVLHRAVLGPWAERTFTFGSRWTDAQYGFDVAWSPGAQSLEFLRDAATVSLNAWNAFLGVDASAFVLVVIGAALPLAARRSDRAQRYRGLFIVAFFLACAAASLAPPLLSDFRWTGYRILVGPVLLVCVALLWALARLLPERLLTVACLLLACTGAAAFWTAVHEARTEVRCLQDFARTTSAETVLLLGEVPGAGRSRLREEFGYRVREVGLAAEFGREVVLKLRREGQLVGSPLRQVGPIAPEELASIARQPRLAVLDVSAAGCACVTGPACGDARAGTR
jgi:hypothetical protein